MPEVVSIPRAPRPAKSRSIRRRLFSLIVLLVLVASAIICACATITAWLNGRDQVLDKLESVANIKRAEVRTWTRNLHSELTFVLHDEGSIRAIHQVLQEKGVALETAEQKLIKRFQEALGLFQWIDEVYLMDARGDVVLSSNPSLKGRFLGLHSYFTEGLHLPGTHVQTLSFSGLMEGVNSVVTVQPIRNEGGESIGALCGRASLVRLNEIMGERAGLGRTGETYLVGLNQVLLTDSREPGFEPGAAYLDSPPIRTLVADKSDGRGFTRNYRGKEVATARLWLPELKAGLLAEQEKGDAFTDYVAMTQINVAVSLLACALAAVGALLLAGKLAGPIGRLSEAANRIARGEYHHRVAVEGEDEIAALANAFNRMSAQLEEAFTVLRDREQNLAITLDSIGDAVIATNAKGDILRMNPVAASLTGWSAAEAMGRPLPEVFNIESAKDGSRVENPVEIVLKQGRVVGLANDTVLVARDGKRRQIADSGAPIRDAKGSIQGVVLVFRDVTEEYETQDRLRHAQKMEAVGQLAGGVAHDFNNLLTGILGNAQLLDLYLQGDPRDGPSPERLRQMIDDIQKASGRAADLTRQLLSFSRKARLQSVPVDIHEIIEEVVGLLSHSIDRRIEIKIRLNAPRHVVKGDPTQIQNALLNLGLNARDAMPEGGVLTYETAVERIDQSFHRAGDEELSPGEYLRIRVIDTGVGMDRQLQQRVFEPFFTTKKEGRGTGLGLAAVYGCAKNHHGCVRLESEPGKGSTFLVYLPALGETTGVESVGAKVALKSGRGRVLVVDDEPIVRNFVVNILEELGYAAHACVDGLDAVEWFALNHSRVDLVILDIIMPRMNGEQAFRKLREIEPHIPVLIVSGYSQRHSIRDLLDHGARAFLSKPFQVTELAQSVSSHIRRSSS